MSLVVLIVVLGGVGAVLRAVTTRALPPLLGTLAINLCAAFLLGLSFDWDGMWADALRVGLLGAASTWSTLAHELASLVRERRFALFTASVLGNLVLGVLAAWVGLGVG